MSEELKRTGTGMIWVAALLVLGGLTWLFSMAIDDRRNPNRQVASSASGGTVEVTLDANRQGHYVATGTINDRDVEFLVDTGATLVSVPESMADDLGLERGPGIRLETAAGPVQGWLTEIDRVTLGGITRRDVRGAISPGRSDTVLLGMSFLEPLELNQRSGTLVLRSRNAES